MTKIVEGFVETFNGLERIEIIDSDNDIVVYQNGELRDDVTILEFLEEVGGYYYESKKHFKNEASSDLSIVVLRYIMEKSNGH
jgi:hypothetical protein